VDIPLIRALQTLFENVLLPAKEHITLITVLVVGKHQDANVGTLPKKYICNIPLPQVPRVESAKSRVQVHAIPDYYKTTYSVPTYISPRSMVEIAAYAFSPEWHAIAIFT
jgi:hypothetical protein